MLLSARPKALVREVHSFHFPVGSSTSDRNLDKLEKYAGGQQEAKLDRNDSNKESRNGSTSFGLTGTPHNRTYQPQCFFVILRKLRGVEGDFKR